MAAPGQGDAQKPLGEPRPYIPTRVIKTDFPLIDNDPHIFRACSYMRNSDYAKGAALATLPPGMYWLMERVSPMYLGRGGFSSGMRLCSAIGLMGGFIFAYQNSCLRLYGCTENTREVARDMREMTDKVKRGEPLYGKSDVSEYMQGVASRNSRYTAFFIHVIPMFNFVNHNQHGVDTAKYYRQAERELEAERLAKSVEWKDG
ncbi:MAG: hypothetical protein M1828_001877 [Chrysothrix sp. TS-e1954]|nr:MAG: hypothetical protein M1828_001877 [Chrysothrix sp. TS-e1954]